MSDVALKDRQLAMASHLRNPDVVPGPAGVEPRRLKIYQDLIFRNIESFISGGFPVLRSLYTEQDWHALVRTFIDGHRCQSPYFLKISEEFLQYLLHTHVKRECDPPFIAELAHYEWVELALDVSEEVLPTAAQQEGPLLEWKLTLSPLAWSLAYQYPVHQIGPGFQPGEAGEATYLTVYRDRDDVVQFMELNAATARMLELFRDNETASVGELLRQLASEMSMAEQAILEFGASQVQGLLDRDILVQPAT